MVCVTVGARAEADPRPGRTYRRGLDPGVLQHLLHPQPLQPVAGEGPVDEVLGGVREQLRQAQLPCDSMARRSGRRQGVKNSNRRTGRGGPGTVSHPSRYKSERRVPRRDGSEGSAAAKPAYTAQVRYLAVQPRQRPTGSMQWLQSADPSSTARAHRGGERSVRPPARRCPAC